MGLTDILAIVSPIATMFFGAVIYKRNYKNDITGEANKSAQLISDMGYVKSGIDDLKRRQEKADEQHIEVISRLTAVEESAKQAHRRIDNLVRKED